MAEQLSWSVSPLQCVQGLYIRIVWVGVLPIRCLNHQRPGVAVRVREYTYLHVQICV